jgi:hypothetical protein
VCWYICRFPAYIYHSAAGFDIYGLPSHVNSGVKIGKTKHAFLYVENKKANYE